MHEYRISAVKLEESTHWKTKYLALFKFLMTSNRNSCPLCNHTRISIKLRTGIFFCTQCGLEINPYYILCRSCFSTVEKRNKLNTTFTSISTCYSCSKRDICACCARQCNTCNENICNSEMCLQDCFCGKVVCTVCVNLCEGKVDNNFICAAILCGYCKYSTIDSPPHQNFCKDCYLSLGGIDNNYI